MEPAQNRRAPRRATPRQRLSAELRRESIVEVARNAFAARGYDGVRTQELAKAAGISEALIYQHFTNKADLYREVATRTCEDLGEQLAAVAAVAPAGDRLERGLEAFLAFVADRSSGWAMLASRVSDPEVEPSQRAAYRSCVGALTDLFQAEVGGKRSAAVRRQLEQLAEAIAGGAEALAKYWNDHPKARRAEGTAMLIDFARHGIDTVADSR
jgi:AcrR family transcriptional regulator